MRSISRVVVVGRLQQRTWTAEDCSARQVVEVVAEELGPSLRWATATPVKASLRAAACGGRPRPARPNRGLAAITCGKLGRSYSTYYLIARHFKLPIRFMNNINQIDP